MQTLNLTKEAYEAYGKHVGWRSVKGDKMPQFDALPDPIKDAWDAAVTRVVELVEGEPIGDPACEFTDDEFALAREHMLMAGEFGIRVDRSLIGGVRRDDGTEEVYTRETRDADLAKLRADGVDAVAFP